MKKINYLDTIKSPVITEKATGLSEQNKVVFKVHENASKNSIKKNIEKIFKVKVIKINTIKKKPKIKIVRGKVGKKVDLKKQLLTLKKGQSIDLATGVLKMSLKTYKPYTKSTRTTVLVDRKNIWKGSPVKSLTKGKVSTGGRNNLGRITSRSKGAGHKKRYRIIDFYRNKIDVLGKS